HHHQACTTHQFNHSSGGNPDHAAVPPVAINYQAEGVQQLRFLLESCMNGIQNPAFFGLPIGIELVELARNFAGADCILHAEEFDHIAGNIHAAGSIDAGRDAESNFAGCEWASI